MICKFLCVPFLISAQANEFHYADSLYHAGNFVLAAVEYERIIFESPSAQIKAEAALKKAGSLKLSGRFDEAASTLDAVHMMEVPDSLRYKMLFESALDAYLARQPNEAFSKLENICHFFPDSSDKHDIVMMKILSLNEMNRWKEARVLYSRFMLAYGPPESAFPDPYRHIPKLKDPDKAEKLSAYLPLTGAGLFYAGSITEGMLSLILQVSFISFGVYSIVLERYITGILIGVGGYAAFYKGGVRRARSLAETNNKKKAMAFNQAVKAQLLQAIKNRTH